MMTSCKQNHRQIIHDTIFCPVCDLLNENTKLKAEVEHFKTQAGEQRSLKLDAQSALEKLKAENERLRRTLEYLRDLGGLGLDVHNAIRMALKEGGGK